MTESTKQSPAAQTTETVTESKSLLDQIIDEGRMAREDTQKAWAKDLIGEFVGQIMEGAMVISKDTEAMINTRISQLDRLISRQLNEVMHHEAFQKLEGSWRGLQYLVNKSETGQRIKIKVLDVSKKDLLKDMRDVSEFNQSALFKKIYEEEYGTFGGAPFGALIGDYEFSNNPQDIFLLGMVSQVAAAAHAPFIAAASSTLFDIESYTNLMDRSDLAGLFDTAGYAQWRSFRESEDSRYVALVLPHILMRLPYGKNSIPVESFDFEEDVDGKVHGKYLWGNAAYALGSKLTESFAKFSWCAAIRGVKGGGLVEGLPIHNFRTDEGDVALKCPTEIAITDSREKELADLGFIPLVHCKGTDYAAFFSTQTVNKAQRYGTPAASANARLSSQLQYIMAVSRFAHYLKAIMRFEIGSFTDRQNAQSHLQNWISNYVCLDVDASQETKARYPLGEARIDVFEITGKPGAFKAVAFLKPHFQLDELSVSLRLVAELPPSLINF